MAVKSPRYPLVVGLHSRHWRVADREHRLCRWALRRRCIGQSIEELGRRLVLYRLGPDIGATHEA
jgi:hypothetical protein